jgi:hypothetical protein
MHYQQPYFIIPRIITIALYDVVRLHLFDHFFVCSGSGPECQERGHGAGILTVIRVRKLEREVDILHIKRAYK